MGTREERLLKHADRMFDAIMVLKQTDTAAVRYGAGETAVQAALAYQEAMSDTATEADDLPQRTDENWISTFTGKRFWPLNPVADGLDIRDIAHALSNLCRFTGHCRHFYSVAQHCVLASEWCHPAIAKWCLLHDAAEAYINDISRPVKRYFPLLKRAEEKTLRMLADRHKLQWPMPPGVHSVDVRMLATERRDVMGPATGRWLLLEQVQPFQETIEAVHPLTAEAMFLARFYELFGTDY